MAKVESAVPDLARGTVSPDAEAAELAIAWTKATASNTQMLEALKECFGWFEADEAEEVPDPGNLRRGLMSRIQAAIAEAKGAAPAREPNSAESERPEGPHLPDPPMSEG